MVREAPSSRFSVVSPGNGAVTSKNEIRAGNINFTRSNIPDDRYSLVHVRTIGEVHGLSIGVSRGSAVKVPGGIGGVRVPVAALPSQQAVLVGQGDVQRIIADGECSLVKFSRGAAEREHGRIRHARSVQEGIFRIGGDGGKAYLESRSAVPATELTVNAAVSVLRAPKLREPPFRVRAAAKVAVPPSRLMVPSVEPASRE